MVFPFKVIAIGKNTAIQSGVAPSSVALPKKANVVASCDAGEKGLQPRRRESSISEHCGVQHSRGHTREDGRRYCVVCMRGAVCVYTPVYIEALYIRLLSLPYTMGANIFAYRVRTRIRSYLYSHLSPRYVNLHIRGFGIFGLHFKKK